MTIKINGADLKARRRKLARAAFERWRDRFFEDPSGYKCRYWTADLREAYLAGYERGVKETIK